MFKEWVKQFLAVILCIVVLVCAFPSNIVYADNYVKEDSDDGYAYYIVDGKSVKALFNFSIGKDVIGNKVMDWLFNFKSFTVIKEHTNKDTGELEYKVYFNTPNLQSIVKNEVISIVADGYTENTYDVNETEWAVPVGNNADNVNAYTKYGFAIPNYTYMGEYPKEVMSIAGIVPKGFWAGVWRAILSIFGVSFIDAPDASNFNTISYLNHQYKDDSDLILTIFEKYYLKYFVNQINKSNFATPQELIAASVTSAENEAAESYTKAHKDEFNEIKKKYEVYTMITKPDPNNEDERVTAFNQYVLFGTTINRNQLEYDTGNRSYLVDKSGQKIVYFTLDGDLENLEKVEKINDKKLGDWIVETAPINRVSRYANLLKDKLNSENVSDRARIINNMNMLAQAYDSSLPIVNTNSSDRDLVRVWFAASCAETSTKATKNITVKSYSSSKNSTNLNSFYSNWSSNKTIEDKDDPMPKEATSSNTSDTSDSSSSSSTTKYYKKPFRNVYSTNSTLSYGSSYKMSLQDYVNFIANYSLFGGFDNFVIDDFLTHEEQLLYDIYTKNEKIQSNYKAFKDRFSKNEKKVDKKNSTIGYSQCLIKSEKSKECISKDEGNGATTISVASLYAYSGLYKITENITSDELTPNQAMEVITKIKAYTGPFYEEVLSNMLIIMLTIASNNNDLSLSDEVMKDDPRVMPFDVDQMPENDRANYDVVDPRVTIYKSHIIGNLISNLELDFSISRILIYIKPQQLLVNLGGKISEIAVFLQRMCSFDVFDDLGLSPTKMWSSAFITLMMMLLALFFIVKTVAAILNTQKRASTAHIVVRFIVLVLELGFAVVFMANPEKQWNNIKRIQKNIVSLGELTSVAANSPKTAYLFGDDSPETLYYLPYLDLWSKYNTGYGINDDEQIMDVNRDKAELREYDPDEFKIGDKPIQHYSVLLADSFSYYGSSTSVASAVILNGNSYNGETINNNAYRVVDHFLAPRVELIKNGDNLQLEVRDNENYNNEFQSGGFFDLLCKLLTCVLLCLLSIIKFFTFLWQWYLLYILVFKIILGRGVENKAWKEIILETFMPTFIMVLIGLYSGIILQVCLNMSGILGMIFIGFLFFLTFLIFKWWRSLSGGRFFPKTLGWLYILTCSKQHHRMKNTERLRQQAENSARDAGITLTKEEQGQFDKRTAKFFNEDGTYKDEYKNDSKFRKSYEEWYKFAVNEQKRGRLFSDAERAAMKTFEADERYKSFKEDVEKYGTGRRLNQHLQSQEKKIKKRNNKQQADNLESDKAENETK